RAARGALVARARLPAPAQGRHGRRLRRREEGPRGRAPLRPRLDDARLAPGREERLDGRHRGLHEGDRARPLRRRRLGEPGRGAARQGLKDMDGAVSDLERAVALAPKLVIAWVNLGKARGSRPHEQKPAIQDLTRALELDPELADAWLARGLLRAEVQDADA